MWEVAFEHHGADSSLSWRKEGRLRGGSGPAGRGAPRTREWHVKPGAGAFPAPHHASPQEWQPGPPPPQTPRIRLRSQRARQAPRAPRKAGTHQLRVPASSVQRRRENGQDQTLPAHPKSQPHPLHPSAQPPRAGPRSPQPRPPRGSGTWARVGVNGGAQGRQDAHHGVTRRGPTPGRPAWLCGPE